MVQGNEERGVEFLSEWLPGKGFASVGEDGDGPVQPADLIGSREAPQRGKLRWYHRNFLSSAVQAEDFLFSDTRGKEEER